jgi:hypothetical protein
MSEKHKEKDWSLCALCEQDTNERLVNPLSSKRPESSDYSSGYQSIAKYLQLLQSIGSLPPGKSHYNYKYCNITAIATISAVFCNFLPI